MYMFYEDATQHSIKRAKQRCNVKSRQTAVSMIRKAIARGKCAEAFTSWERDFLSKVSFNGCTAIAYNSFCYILNEAGCCVTVYPLPAWFGKKKHFDGKTRIRNPKRYIRDTYDRTMEEIC